MNTAHATANTLTLSRALLAPLILGVLISDIRGGAGPALILTGIAMATDYLDGAVARRYAVESRFGKVADPFTDALVFLAIFVGLAVRGVLPFWLPALIAGREAAMHAIVRPALLRLDLDAGARPVGKFKTLLQAGVTIVVLLVMLVAPEQARSVAVPLVSAAAVVSIISLYWYVEPIVSRRAWDRLGISIVATCLSLWLLQLAIVAVAAELGLLDGAAFYALLHTGLAAGMIFLLLKRRCDFVIVGGSHLPRVNSANVLTLARLTSIPTMIFLITSAAKRAVPAWPVLTVLAVVLLTDLADGILARRRSQVTRVGSYLDSSTDYLLLGAAAILSLAYGIGTPWVFIALIGRLAVQAVAVVWIASVRQPLPAATRLGKASIAAGMVLLLAELVATLGERGLRAAEIITLLRTFLEIGLTGILAASAVEKVALLIRTIRQSSRRTP